MVTTVHGDIQEGMRRMENETEGNEHSTEVRVRILSLLLVGEHPHITYAPREGGRVYCNAYALYKSCIIFIEICVFRGREG